MTIGERIYYCRTEKHMTQKELGQRAGINSVVISRYENDVLNPKIGTLKKIADALGVPISTFVDGFEVETNTSNTVRQCCGCEQIKEVAHQMGLLCFEMLKLASEIDKMGGVADG